MFKLLSLSTALIIVLISISNADQRRYVWTYQFSIMDKGKAEIEQYTTFEILKTDSIEATTKTQLQVEAEIGMNENYDFSIYQVFSQNPSGNLVYDGFKLRSRYLLAKKDNFIFDPLIYLEYTTNPNFSKHEIEAKLIMAKDAGDFNFSVNPIFKFEYDEEWNFSVEYAIGASYTFGRLLDLSIEAKGSKNSHYIGPTISHGTPNLWIALGFLKKIDKIDPLQPEFQTRMILGIGI